MLTLRETATILAALQYWREEICPHGRAIMRPYFHAVGLDHLVPLHRTEIARLSARLRAEARLLDG